MKQGYRSISIEAAKTLYESHSVEDITRHEADKVSSDATIAYILGVIQKSKTNREICLCKCIIYG